MRSEVPAHNFFDKKYNRCRHSRFGFVSMSRSTAYIHVGVRGNDEVSINVDEVNNY